jgi:hypothetical protein
MRKLRAGSAARVGAWSADLERQARDLILSDELTRIAEGAIRVMKQGAGGIPLKGPVAVLEISRSEGRARMSDLLHANGMEAEEFTPDPATWPVRIKGSALMTVASRARLGEADTALARAWLTRFPETVTVASLNPHVCDEWPEVRTVLATFDNGPAARRGLARRLTGAGLAVTTGRRRTA